MVTSNVQNVNLFFSDFSFARFTSQWKQPFDNRIQTSMALTASDLLNRFSAQSAYAQTDEINLVFLPPSQRSTIRRVVRLVIPLWFDCSNLQVSLMAGYASVRFNYHLASQSFTAEEESVHSNPKTFAYLLS